MILNAITGFSASMRPEEKSLGGFISDVLKDMPDRPAIIHKNIEFSSKENCIPDSIHWMNTVSGNQILLVGKSMGGVKTWWMIHHYWKNILARFNTGPTGKLGVLLIDPHGWQRGDGCVGSYGLEIDEMRANREWERADVRIKCLYQRNSYPKGAMLGDEYDAWNTKLGKDATHWNVEDFNTATGKLVAEELKTMIRWVNQCV
jgi:hypothetical protein